MGEVGFEVQLNLNGHENGEDVIALKKSLHHENGDGIHQHEEEDEHDGEQEYTITNGTASHEHNEHVGEEEKALENGVHKGEEHHHHEDDEEEDEDEQQHEVDESYHSKNTNTNTHHPTIEEQTKNTNEQHQIEFSVTNTESIQDNGEHISVVVLENGTDHKHEEEEEEEEEEEKEKEVEVETHHNQQQPQNETTNNVNNDENKHTTNTTSEPEGRSNGHHFHSSSYIDEPQDKITSENLDSSFVILSTNETKETREGEDEEDEEDEEEATHSKEKGGVEAIVAEEGSVNVSAPRLSEDEVLEEALKPFINDSSSPIPLQQPTTPPREELEPPTVSPRVAAQKLKDVGNAHFSAGRFDESIECYSQAIALDPEDSVYYSNRSAAYLSKGLSQEALKDGLKAIQLKPNWSKAYVRAGRAYLMQEKYQETIDILEEGLRKDPSAPQKEIADLINSCKLNLKKKEQPSSSSSGPSPSAGGLGTNQHKRPVEEDAEENEEGDSDDYEDFEEKEEENVQTGSTLKSKTNEPQPQKALIARSGTFLLLFTTLAGLGFTFYRFIVKGK